MSAHNNCRTDSCWFNASLLDSFFSLHPPLHLDLNAEAKGGLLGEEDKDKDKDEDNKGSDSNATHHHCYRNFLPNLYRQIAGEKLG